MSNSVSTKQSRRTRQSSVRSRPTHTHVTKGPKLCKCFAREDGTPCYGIPFGIDLMSKTAVKRVTTAQKDRKFQMDLQQHTRRMGWGVPMKPVPIHLPDDENSVYSKASKKGRMKGKGRPKMPKLHRASSAEKFEAHPNHGTLDSSAKQAAPDLDDLKQDGKPWWEGAMASHGGGVEPSSAPLPPTSSSAISSAMEEFDTEKDEILNMEIGAQVPFNDKQVRACEKRSDECTGNTTYNGDSLRSLVANTVLTS